MSELPEKVWQLIPEQATLRDQLAMAALPECLRKWHSMTSEDRFAMRPFDYATMAYDAADSMLAVRSGKGEG